MATDYRKGPHNYLTSFIPLARLIHLLTEAEIIAERLELTLGNGALVDALIGGIANELQLKLEAMTANPEGR